MISTIVDIIRLLNDGNVIPFQADKETKFNLYSDVVELYVDSSGNENKYYYFAEYKMDYEKKDNLDQIESILQNNKAFADNGKPSPSDSYMILLWEIEKIEDCIYPYIIDIEENEFFYKKYIFYYTKKEFDCFISWYKELQENGKSNLTKTLDSLQKLDDESEVVKFLTRLLIKVPFLNPVFPKTVLDDFDKMVQQKIMVIRNKQKASIEMINNIFITAMENEDHDIEALSNVIYQKLMEE